MQNMLSDRSAERPLHAHTVLVAAAVATLRSIYCVRVCCLVCVRLVRTQCFTYCVLYILERQSCDARS
jgi:hypothetical protein